MLWVLWCRSKHAHLCTPWAGKGIFEYLKWWCLKHTMPIKYGVGCGLALRTRIPLRTMGQKRCFWIPKMVVFETHHAKRYAVGPRVALQTRIPVHTLGQKRCFWMPEMVLFEAHHA